VGYKVRMQKVERPTNKSYYVNFPAVIAEATTIEKGETMEWLIEDQNTFILRRVKPRMAIMGPLRGVQYSRKDLLAMHFSWMESMTA
jgi:hypothetical protein